MRDPFTGDSRGFGFVTFSNESCALKAIEILNGTEVKGRRLTVEVAKRNRPRKKTPGMYLGKYKSEFSRRSYSRSRSREKKYKKKKYYEEDSYERKKYKKEKSKKYKDDSREYRKKRKRSYSS